jgi:hypothetical protein
MSSSAGGRAPDRAQLRVLNCELSGNELLRGPGRFEQIAPIRPNAVSSSLFLNSQLTIQNWNASERLADRPGA